MADEAPNVEQPSPAEPEPEPEVAERPESEVPAPEGSAEQAATEAIEQVEAAAQSIAAETVADPHVAEAVQLPDFAPPEQDAEQAAATLGLLHDVDLTSRSSLAAPRCMSRMCFD